MSFHLTKQSVLTQVFQRQVNQGQAVQGQTSQQQPAQQPQMSMQALKDSLPSGGLSGQGGIPVTVTAGSGPAAVTAGSRPQQQPRGPYNKQVLNHGKFTSIDGMRAVQLQAFNQCNL